MKTHIIEVKCDKCKLTRECSEVIMAYGKRAWASDLCAKCKPVIEQLLTDLGMGGQQARPLPGSPKEAKAAKATKQDPDAAITSAKQTARSYKGRKCRGCGTTFNTEPGRRTHSGRTGCA